MFHGKDLFPDRCCHRSSERNGANENDLLGSECVDRLARKTIKTKYK